MANLRELLARIGWSDTELSRRVSVPPRAVRDWRTGRREVPPHLLDWLRMYAEAIDRLPPCRRTGPEADALSAPGGFPALLALPPWL